MNLLDALRETGKAEHESGLVVCMPRDISNRKLEIPWEKALDSKWRPSPRTGFFEKIAKIGVPGKTMLYNRAGKEREVYCGFTSGGKMITDDLEGSGYGIVHYSDEDLHCWYLEGDF